MVNALLNAALWFEAQGRQDGRFGYVGPLYKQVKRASWDYFRRYAGTVPGVKFNESELTITFAGGNKIYVDGSDNPDGLRGSYYDGVVLDEVAQMKPEVWDEVVRPMLSDRKGWAAFIGTPKGQDRFFKLYNDAKSDPTWYDTLHRADETGVLDAAELESARLTMSAEAFRQEYLCDFSASSDNVLITIDLISEACQRKVVHEDALFGLPKVMGVDVARYGADSSVIVKRHGHFTYNPMEFRQLDNMHIAGVVAQQWDEWNPDSVFIDGGRGEGVIDRLRQLGYSPIEVQFGGRKNLIDQVHYNDKRTEMYDRGRKWIEDGGVLPNHSRLKSDLCSLTYDFGGVGGSMRLVSKEQMRREGQDSTDFGDAWALSFAFPVNPKDKVDPLHEAFAQHRIVTDFDPYPVEAA